MSEALNLIYNALDAFSGKETPEEAMAGLVDVIAEDREKARGVLCLKACRFPAWADGCPYLYVRGTDCAYYGLNDEEQDDDDL
jgi:hypothetical protein